MHPLLWNNPAISSYGVMVVVGIVLGWLIARVLGRRAGVEAWKIDYAVPVLSMAGIAGAYVFGVLTDWATGKAAGETGAVLAGSLVASTAAGVGYAKWLGVRVGVFGDVLAGPIMVAVAVGRLGCFLGGCCWGKVCGEGGLGGAVGVHFPRGSFAWREQVERGVIGVGERMAAGVWPTQLLEAAGAGLIAAMCIWGFGRKGRVSGELFLMMGMAYGGMRFGMEFLRGDNPGLGGVWGALTFSQVVMPMLVVAALGVLIARRRGAERWGLRI